MVEGLGGFEGAFGFFEARGGQVRACEDDVCCFGLTKRKEMLELNNST